MSESYKQAEIVIGCDARTTAQIIQQMKDEGYLTLGTKSRLVLVDSVEQTKIRNHDYCNPMTLIKIYVSFRHRPGKDIYFNLYLSNLTCS